MQHARENDVSVQSHEGGNALHSAAVSAPDMGRTAGRRLSIAVLAALVAGIGAAFYNAFGSIWKYHWFPSWGSPTLGLYDRFFEGDSYYTHGPLVPIVSICIGWLILRRRTIAFRPARILGLCTLALSLASHVLSSAVGIDFPKGFAFVGVIAGLVLTLWGVNALKRLWFPVAFLLLMMPLPPMVISDMLFKLKMLAADWGVTVAGVFGVPVERAGSTVLLSEGRSMVVGNVCSGLRTLISLVGFGAIYVYGCRLRGFWRFVLAMMLVPVAVASNCLRVVALIVVAHVWGVPIATGWFHDLSGPLVFLLAFFFMFALEEAIVRLRQARGKPPAEVGILPELRRPPGERVGLQDLTRPGGSVAGILAAVLIAAAAFGVHGISGEPPTGSKDIGQGIPKVLAVEGTVFVGQDMELDPKVWEILRRCPYVNRTYTADGGAGVVLFISYSQGSRRSSHPPDVCLAGGGNNIIARNQVTVTVGDGGGDVACGELVIQKGDGQEYYLYTYRCGPEYTPNWYHQQCSILWNNLLGRHVTGGLIRLSTPVNGGDVDGARRRLSEFLRALSPHLDRTMT